MKYLSCKEVNMVRQIINKSEQEEEIVNEIQDKKNYSREKEQKKDKEELQSQEIYVQQVCVPMEQMLNIINQKIDNLIRLTSSCLKLDSS